MNVIFSKQNFSYACAELATSLSHVMPTVRKVASEVASQKVGSKNLVVVLACPCCCSTGIDLNSPDNILVSPLAGMDPAGHSIHTMEQYPEYYKTDEEYAEKWRELLEKAINGT
jgi:hypothetical protein